MTGHTRPLERPRLLVRRWSRIRRLLVGAGPGLALCVATAGLAWGQAGTSPRTPQQAVPGGPKLPTLPDLVILEFHYSYHHCSPAGYRGWFSGKNKGLGPALFHEGDTFVSISFQGKTIGISLYPNPNDPIPAGGVWASISSRSPLGRRPTRWSRG